LAVGLACGAETGAAVDFDEPDLEGLVDQQVEALTLEAVAVVDDHVLHRLETLHDDRIHLVLDFLQGFLPPRHLQVQVQRRHAYLASVFVIVVFHILLDCVVGEVTRDVLLVHVLLFYAESAKPQILQPNLQRTERSHQDIDPQVKLLATYQKRFVNIFTDHIAVFQS